MDKKSNLDKELLASLLNNTKTSRLSKEHPKERANFFSRAFMTWLSPLTRISLKYQFEESDHWNIHSKIKMENNLPKFEQHYGRNATVASLIYDMFSCKTLLAALLVLRVFFHLSGYVLIYVMIRALMRSLRDQASLDLATLGIYLGGLLAIEFMRVLISSLCENIAFNESLVAHNCLVFAVVRKSIDLPLADITVSGRRGLLGLAQNDCTTIKQETKDLPYLAFIAVICLACCAFCVALIGVPFLAFVGIGLGFLGALLLIGKVEAGIEEKRYKSEVKRMSAVQHMLRGLRHIKFHALERFFLKNIFDNREKEMRRFQRLLGMFSVTVFLNWLFPQVSFLTSLTWLSTGGTGLSLAAALVVYKVFDFLGLTFRLMPYAYTSHDKLTQARTRVDSFLALKRTDMSDLFSEYSFMRESVDLDSCEQDPDEPQRPPGPAIKIVNGHFGYKWADDSDSDETQIKPSDDQSDRVGTGRQALGRLTGPRGTSAWGFELRDIRLEIEWGELTFVVGKPRSGKTTLLMSILGEVVPKSPESRIQLGSKSVAYSPQEPFVQAKSLLENIVFYSELDEQRLRSSLRMAQLDPPPGRFAEEMQMQLYETFPEDFKTQVNLARCFYQDSDIYLLDEPFLELEKEVAEPILEEMLRKRGQQKTLVLTSSSNRFLAHADRVVFIDKGQVVFEGSYPDFCKTAWSNQLEDDADEGALAYEEVNYEMMTLDALHAENTDLVEPGQPADSTPTQSRPPALERPGSFLMLEEKTPSTRKEDSLRDDLGAKGNLHVGRASRVRRRLDPHSRLTT